MRCAMFLDDFLYMHLHIIGSSVRGVRGSMHLLVPFWSWWVLYTSDVLLLLIYNSWTQHNSYESKGSQNTLSDEISSDKDFPIGKKIPSPIKISISLANFCLNYVLIYWTKYSWDKKFCRQADFSQSYLMNICPIR